MTFAGHPTCKTGGNLTNYWLSAVLRRLGRLRWRCLGRARQAFTLVRECTSIADFSVYLLNIGKGKRPADRGPGGPVKRGSCGKTKGPKGRNKTMTMIRNYALAFTAAIAMTLGGAASEAQAGNHNGAYFAGGLVAGAIIGTALTRPVYAAPTYGVVYAAPVQHCWMQKEFVGYNYKGQKMYQKVQVCD
jgi:hypothetical protein